MRAIGIDISDRTIEVADIRQRFGSNTIKAIGRTTLADGVVEDGEYKDIEALTEHLKQSLSQANPQPIKVTSAYFSLPESKVFTHVFTFPRELKKSAIEEAIGIQFSEYFPYDIDQTAYDWKIVQESDQTQMVLVGACKKEYVEQIMTLAEKADIRIAGIDIESVSTSRALLPKPKDVEAYMLVDAGAYSTSISIFDQAGLQSTFVCECGGDRITQQLIKDKSLNEHDAEEMWQSTALYTKKEDGGEEKQSEVRKIMIDQLTPVIEEMKRTIEFYEGSRRKTVKAVYLCGGLSLQQGFREYVNEQLSLPVHTGDPLSHIKHHDIVSKNDKIILYANVIGLALGTLDRQYHHTKFNFLKSIHNKK